jgi:hypothetical protein
MLYFVLDLSGGSPFLTLSLDLASSRQTELEPLSH